MVAVTDPYRFDPQALAPAQGSQAARNCGRNGEKLTKLHVVSRLSELDQDLSQRLINDTSRREALKPQIESSARQLASPPFAGADAYAEESGGLFGRRKAKVEKADETQAGESTSGLVSPPTRQRIDHYLQASGQNARQVPLHVIAMIVGVAVFCGALFVDYMIVTEFWTRALANEFLELPGSLADSVAFKSAQVLFAAIAAHLLFASLGRGGQKVFTRIVFLFAVMMLAGLGFLLATMSLPQGTADVFGGTTSLDSALADLGLGDTTGPAATVPEDTGPSLADEAMSRDLHTATWLGSLGVIFLVVTGVAAIALHAATTGLRHLVAVGDYRARNRQAEALARAEHEYVQLGREIEQLERPDARRAILWAGLMREVQAHLDGLDEARTGLSRAQQLQASRSSSGGVFRRGGGNAVAPTDTRESDLRERIAACTREMSIEEYEDIFDGWWANRSQGALARDAHIEGGARLYGSENFRSLPGSKAAD